MDECVWCRRYRRPCRPCRRQCRPCRRRMSTSYTYVDDIVDDDVVDDVHMSTTSTMTMTLCTCRRHRRWRYRRRCRRQCRRCRRRWRCRRQHVDMRSTSRVSLSQSTKPLKTLCRFFGSRPPRVTFYVNVLQYIYTFVLQCVAACCSVLQRVALRAYGGKRTCAMLT